MASRAPKTRSKKKLILTVIAVLVVGGLVYFFRDHLIPPPAETRYEGAGYSFVYPRTYDLVEYSRNAVGLWKDGRPATQQVEVVIYRNDPDQAVPTSYQAFVEAQAINLCGTDSGTEKVECSEVISIATTTAQGYVGQQLGMTLTRTNLISGTTTIGALEPIYVFDLAQGRPADATGYRYKALFVYPSVSTALMEGGNKKLIEQIAGTLVSNLIPLKASPQ
jgi:hypothetical protein